MSEFLLKNSPENLADEAKKKMLIALKWSDEFQNS
jgi:hypothetical protein